MELLKPQDAARLMSVSYPTLKQWIYNGKVHSVKTPGGHHRIPRTEIERFSTTTKYSNVTATWQEMTSAGSPS